MFAKKKLFIIFFGPPGSGKGTQADMLGQNLGLPVVSTGELFRNERDKKTQIGKIVEDSLAKGRLIQDQLIEKIFNKRLIKLLNSIIAAVMTYMRHMAHSCGDVFLKFPSQCKPAPGSA